MIQEQVDRMTAVLDQEADVYRALVDLSEKKKAALVAGDLEALDEVVRAEEALLWKAGRVEETRQTMATELADELGLKDGERTLVSLTEAVGEPWSARLQERQGELLKAIGDLAVKNEANGRLIEQSLAQVRLTVGLLARSRQVGAAYGPAGKAAVDDAPLKLDKQI